MPDGTAVDAYTLTSGDVRVVVLAYGGIVQSIETPDRSGNLANVVLGFAGLDDYLAWSPYFGAIIGRYANRIACGRFTLVGRVYPLATNWGPHHLHGGLAGFDKRVWQARQVPTGEGAGLELSYVSPDGQEGYPGTLSVAVTYTLSDNGALRIDYRATTDAPTIVNLTNHSYFNLGGEGSGSVSGHIVEINASHVTPVDDTLIPTGDIAPVAGTPFDFTRPVEIGSRLASGDPRLERAGGFDHNFVLDRSGDRLTPGVQERGLPPRPLTHAGRVVDPISGRVLTVHTTEPGVQFYTAGQLDGSLVGPSGRHYGPGDAFTLETQHFPDSPNQPHFPSTVLRPGQEYSSTTVYTFSTD